MCEGQISPTIPTRGFFSSEIGQIHSFNSGIEWRSRGESMRLNTEKGLSKILYGDRIEAYRCEHCKKILISYE